MTSSLMRVARRSTRFARFPFFRIGFLLANALLGDAIRCQSWNAGQSIARQGWKGSPVRDRERSRHRARASSVANVRGLETRAGRLLRRTALARDGRARDCHRARRHANALHRRRRVSRHAQRRARCREDALALTLADARGGTTSVTGSRQARFRERDPAWSGVVKDPGAGEVDDAFDPTRFRTHHPDRTLADRLDPRRAGADGRLGRRRRGRGRERRGWDERRGGRSTKIFGKPPDRDVKRPSWTPTPNGTFFKGRPVRDDAAAAADARARGDSPPARWAIRGNPAAAAVVDEGRLPFWAGTPGDGANISAWWTTRTTRRRIPRRRRRRRTRCLSTISRRAGRAREPSRRRDRDCGRRRAAPSPPRGKRTRAAAPTTVGNHRRRFQSAAGAVVDDKRDRYAATVDACAPFRALTPSQRRRVADALREAAAGRARRFFAKGILLADPA